MEHNTLSVHNNATEWFERGGGISDPQKLQENIVAVLLFQWGKIKLQKGKTAYWQGVWRADNFYNWSL